MKLIAPEQAALLGTLSFEDASVASASERHSILRDVLARSLTAARDIKLTFLVEMPMFAFVQIGRAFPGRAVVVSVIREVAEHDGFYRRKAGEEHLFHEDSEDYEAATANLNKQAHSVAAVLLGAGVNVGQAYSQLPASANCEVLLTGSIPDFFEFYSTVARQRGLYHPAAYEAAASLWADLKNYAPSLTRVLQGST